MSSIQARQTESPILIDTDIHNIMKNPHDLLPYLAKPWHSQWLTTGTGVGMRGNGREVQVLGLQGEPVEGRERFAFQSGLPFVVKL